MKNLKLLAVILSISSLCIVGSISLQSIALQSKTPYTLSAEEEYPACMPMGYRSLAQGPSAICHVPFRGEYLAIRCELMEGWCAYIDCRPPCYILYETVF